MEVLGFEYFNINPKGEHIKDCVCRAISTATELKYEMVEDLLDLTANHYNCEKLCVCCYNNLLEQVLHYKRTDCNFDVTVRDVAENHPTDKLIIRVNAHLTCSINGTVLDIWDCTNELVDCYWIVE